MSRIVGAVETEFETDFAILSGDQQGGAGVLEAGLFALSAPGSLRAVCGTKYARVRVRAERWDARPQHAEGWEDFDEVPFEEVPGGGALILSGFDPGDAGLDLSGLGASRVQVFARGRHRYRYSSEPETDARPAEEWLLRFFPWSGPPEPLAGGPRRIAGEGGLFVHPGDAWLAAVRAQGLTGWENALLGSHGYHLAHLTLLTANNALPRQAFASQMGRWMPPYQPGGPDSERLTVPPRPGTAQDPLALATGRVTVSTIGDTIDALLELGLLLVESRDGRSLLIPNPDPQPAWERLRLTGERLTQLRVQAMRSAHRLTAADLGNALDWVGPRGLRASPRELALRWATTIDDVIGAIRLLGGAGSLVSTRDLGFDAEIEPDVELWLAPSPG